jgi:hypothetical protein
MLQPVLQMQPTQCGAKYKVLYIERTSHGAVEQCSQRMLFDSARSACCVCAATACCVLCLVYLVYFNMPLPILFKLCKLNIPAFTSALSNSLKHVLYAWHHALCVHLKVTTVFVRQHSVVVRVHCYKTASNAKVMIAYTVQATCFRKC